MTTAEVVPLVPAWALDRTFTYEVPEGLDVSIGSLVRIPLGNRRVRGVVVSLGEGRGSDLEQVHGVVLPVSVAPGTMVALLEEVAVRYATPRGVVFDRVVPPRVRVPRREPGGITRAGVPAPPARYEGMGSLVQALQHRTGGTWVLQASPSEDRGDLIAALAGVCEGQVLVCVPEVRWGSPVVQSIARRFPDLVRLDSAAGDVERSRGWVAMADGHGIGAGGRAAVFAPAPDLGAIFLEDEANRAFKEDRSPRFDARWAAVRRAQLSGAACVLVTSAPSLEAAALVRRGAILVRPSDEAMRAARPNVEIAEPADDGISHALRRAISETLQRGGKVGLLVPQRGYARSLWCPSCHRSVRCPRCEAGVVFERDRAAARCPRCSFGGRAPEVCPNCGAPELLSLGAGSERLAEQLGLIFPRATVRRIDPNVLDGLSEAPAVDDADIYVTTWIGTKAALRPAVSLVGVLDADTLIRRPHMRAAEDAYLALSELARWAGPAAEGGRLLIQTREPSHHAVQSVVRGDPWYFIEREEPIRKELDYPPFFGAVKVRVRGQRVQPVLDRVTEVAESAGAKVLGPVTVTTREGAEVQELMLKCPDTHEVASALRVILPDVPRGTTLWIDVDPR